MLSDVHGNADALSSVLEDAEDWDYVWVLGDLVDYGPEPHVVIDLIRGLRPDVMVMGNHDYAVVTNGDCMCAPEVHELSVYTRLNISRRLLSEEQIKWLSTAPRTCEVSAGGLRVHVVHGSPRNPLYGYLKPTLTTEELRLALTPSPVALRPRPVNADVVITGHTHIPTDIKVDSVRVLNPGSVGQPRDGNPRASYLLIDVDTWSVEARRVKYDVAKVTSRLKTLNLEAKYVAWIERILSSGSLSSVGISK
ncbi:MAG: metallophosphoesterase family protein [Zestosphaera sp.]